MKKSLVQLALNPFFDWFRVHENFFFILTGGKNFFDNFELKRHISDAHTHNQSKEYKCDQCIKAFNFKQNLHRHIRLIHENKKYIYECQACTKIFKSQAGLYRHVQSIHEERKFPCERCGLSFTEKQSLINHINIIHEGIRYEKLNFLIQNIYVYSIYKSKRLFFI